MPLRNFLGRHVVVTAYEKGWSTLQNGELPDAAERDGFGLPITTDANRKHQQHLVSRRIAVVVLMSTRWPRIQRALTAAAAAVDGAATGSYVAVEIP